MLGWKKGAWLLVCGILLFAADVVTKWLTQHDLPLMTESPPVYPYGGIGVLQDFHGIEFSIVYATNKGAVWGILEEYQYPLLALRILLIVGMIIYLLLMNRQPLLDWPFLLIIVGALGNVFDVLVYGHVVDMLFFRLWGWGYPVFNMADSLIFIGVVWLLILSIIHSASNSHRAKT